VDDVRRQLIAQHQIELVVDVGANTGQYAHGLREGGYTGAIVSFEPLPTAFEQLCTSVHQDANWSAYNLALGDTAGPALINVAANSYSSSFLQVTAAHVDAAPDAAFSGREEVAMQTIDALPQAWFAPGARLLKIDTQGYEPAVLRGAEAFLRTVELVELEMSIIPIYAEQDLAHQVLAQMRDLGFVPVALKASFAHPSTREIQCIDAIFARLPEAG
jgi:FkbM family methyltransferase